MTRALKRFVFLIAKTHNYSDSFENKNANKFINIIQYKNIALSWTYSIVLNVSIVLLFWEIKEKKYYLCYTLLGVGI